MMRHADSLSIQSISEQDAGLAFQPTDQTFPDAERLVTALRQIGYGLEQALADLVDNSINAGASKVLIRFLHDGEEIRAVAVVDDGCGMTGSDLKDAMRFGSLQESGRLSLGKYGMGLKLASLSHAQTLSVYSRRRRRAYGRRWTFENICRGWWCQRLSSPLPQQMLDARWSSLDITDSGTVVLWENLDRLPAHKSGLRYTLSSFERRLRLHLGLTFHRFLEEGSLAILIDQHHIDRPGQSLSSRIQPLNPFDYPVSGDLEYPVALRCLIPGVGALTLEAHVWPANSTAPQYRLGRRAASRQGFYIYRNSRLIQAGGWNGVFQDETEPHSSLARIRVDLPPELDENFGVNVQKSQIIVPPAFVESVHDATSKDGRSFDDFRRAALHTYRSANKGSRNGPVAPGRGVTRHAQQRFSEIYHTADKPISTVDFKWKKLPDDKLFDVDWERSEIHLNRKFRGELSGSVDARGTDATAFKLLLFQVLKQALERGLTTQRARQASMLNDLLIAAIRGKGL